jgi:hypothetical protein
LIIIIIYVLFERFAQHKRTKKQPIDYRIPYGEPMQKITSLLAIATLLAQFSFSALVQASERPDHFKGQEISNATQARSYYQEYNNKLKVLLAQTELNPAQLLEIHEITYTLENALTKLPAESAKLAEVLESLHLASEQANATAAKKFGAAYLQAVAEVSAK